MLKKASRLLIATLILLELGMIITATLPPRTMTAKATLETEMAVVFVDPLNVTADVGESFTISVKVFNLSQNFYTTEEAWVKGEPLPPLEPDYWRYKYSLGHLWAFDLRLSWDPTILEYVSHTVTVPVEDHVGGILHAPVIEAADTVDPAAGTYWLARSSQAPAEFFSAPGANATVFTMTFNVKKQGKCDINLTQVDLVTSPLKLGLLFGLQDVIPFWAKNCEFRTGALSTRIENVQAGALVAGSLLDPAIEGEDVTVNIAMRNDNETITDTFNLTLYEGTTVLAEWQNEELAPDTAETYSYTIEGLDRGLYTATAEVSVRHGGELLTDEFSRNFTVVDTPNLQISGPTSATTGTMVTFSASESVHNDPNGEITTYTWTLWALGATQARDTKTGESVSFELPPTTENIGDWTVMLVVKDNFDITAKQLTGSTLTPTTELLRPTTAPYRKLWTLNVQLSGGPGLNIEWIILAVALIVIIALAVFYLRRRSK